MIAFHDRVHCYVHHVEDTSSGELVTYEMPDYVQMRAALEVHGVPRRDWPVFTDGVRLLFALDHDLVDLEALLGPEDEDAEPGTEMVSYG